jgi:cell division protein FtsB
MSYEPPEESMTSEYNRMCARVKFTEQKCVALEAENARLKRENDAFRRGIRDLVSDGRDVEDVLKYVEKSK